MKKQLFTLGLTLVIGIGFYSCTEEEIKPKVSHFESFDGIGKGGNHMVSVEDRDH